MEVIINMFCTKCGYEYSGDADFCVQCGASVTSKEPLGETLNAATPITKKEYFSNNCSTSTKKKRKVIKILCAVSLVIQCVLSVLFVIGLGILAYAVEQNLSYGGSVSGTFISIIASVLIITAGSFVFTIIGIKKNSTGFFVAATIFSFLSAAMGSNNFENRILRLLIAFGILAIYIVIVILNHQNNKEYKEYISEQKGSIDL